MGTRLVWLLWRRYFAAMTQVELPIQIDAEKVAVFCREHGIRKLSLFGSELRDDFDPARSDVDVLVEFLPGRIPGWEFFGWGEDFAAIIGRTADLQTPNSLSPHFREEVLCEAVPLYEQT